MTREIETWLSDSRVSNSISLLLVRGRGAVNSDVLLTETLSKFIYHQVIEKNKQYTIKTKGNR